MALYLFCFLWLSHFNISPSSNSRPTTVLDLLYCLHQWALLPVENKNIRIKPIKVQKNWPYMNQLSKQSPLHALDLIAKLICESCIACFFCFAAQVPLKIQWNGQTFLLFFKWYVLNIQESLPVLFWRNDIQAFMLTMVELVLNDYHFIGWCVHRMCALTDLSGHTCLEACRKCWLLVRVKCYWHHRIRATCQNKWAASSLTSFLWIENQMRLFQIFIWRSVRLAT